MLMNRRIGAKWTGRRVCRFSKVESKVFEYVWFKGEEKSEEVMLNERGSKGYFETRTSVGVASWLGKVLCHWSMEGNSGNREKYEDVWGSALVIRKKNKGGEYALCLFFNKRYGGRASSICYPQGFAKGGWTEVGSRMLELFDLNLFRRSEHTRVDERGAETWGRSRREEQVGHGRNNNGVSYNIERRGNEAYLKMEGQEKILNSEKWLKVVVMEGTIKGSIELGDIINEVEKKLVGATCKAMESGELMIFLQTEKEAVELARAGKKTFGGIVFKIQRWKCEMNSIMGALTVVDRWVWLRGVPYHLKTEEVIKRIGSTIGDIREIEEESLKVESSGVRIKIKMFDLSKCPRYITVKEKGYNYIIVIVPEFSTRMNRSWTSVVRSGGEGSKGARQPETEKTGTGVVVVGERGGDKTCGEGRVGHVAMSEEEVPPGFGGIVTLPAVEIDSLREGTMRVASLNVSEDRLEKDEVGEAGVEAANREATVYTKKGDETREGIGTSSFFEVLHREDREEGVEQDNEGESTSGPSRVSNSIVEEAQTVIEVEVGERGVFRKGGPRRERSKSREKNRARTKTPIRKGGGMGFGPSLVLSKRIEWEAHRRAVLKSKSGKSIQKEKAEKIQMRKKEREDVQVVKEGDSEKGTQVTGRVLRIEDVSNETPVVEFDESSDLRMEFSEGEDVNDREFDPKNSNKDILLSLARCSSEEDIDNWFKWVVLPSSTDLGLTHKFGNDFLKKYLRNLCMKSLGKNLVEEVRNGGDIVLIEEEGEGGVTIVNNVG
ncbi:hypothetical protein FRX31_014502 [Thalictrum thalictroides]|uniref:DUF4283 domain-containing protein n=1 Tax=Thalictrum thalictroides TaxID=46969 RepID=A0A7J6WEW2_THATH|nr:hypothetical protein FRX31_014502 [Thalictrum thalictroides]